MPGWVWEEGVPPLHGMEWVGGKPQKVLANFTKGKPPKKVKNGAFGHDAFWRSPKFGCSSLN